MHRKQHDGQLAIEEFYFPFGGTLDPENRWVLLSALMPQEHGKRPRPSRGPAPRDLDARGRMDRKIRSIAGQAVYALRKTIVEPVFGQIKGARGLDCFLLRGLEKVEGEWALFALTHNIRKLHTAALASP